MQAIPGEDSGGSLRLIHQVGLPILAGTDDGADAMLNVPPGFTLQAELALYVAEGMSTLEALQAATLNPAKMLHGTDSLGTVAVGKLADLVVLDADPLADITNITTIRAVVANGRYFDRAALDQLLTRARAQVTP
jgi:imidazolonepropionase-like amidohydrolase